MKLEELKKQNEEETKKQEESEEDVVVEEPEEIEDLEEEEVDEDLEDSEDEDSEESKEAWQMTDEDEQKLESKDEEVPLKTHLKIKGKLKGRLKDSEEEKKRLQEENERLRAGDKSLLKEPKPEDYDTDDEFESAKKKYDDALLDEKIAASRKRDQETKDQQRIIERRNKAVDEHYDRAAELISSSGMKAENFQKADKRVREVVDMIIPGGGDPITDHMIDLVGKGSEKVFFYIGVNENARNKFQSLLTEDKTGMKAAVWLGQEKQRLTQPKKITSKAPAPAPTPKGDDTPASGTIKKYKKAYDKAHRNNSPQDAYNAKKAAKKAGVDVSKW